MAGDENKATVRQVLESVWGRGDVAQVERFFSNEFVRHGPQSLEGDVQGPDGFKQLVGMYRTAFPDLQVAFDDQLVAGDLVVTRWTARGTHRGELVGLAPSGRSIAVVGVIIDRFSGGQIAEEWASYDSLGLLQQVGAAPAAGASSA